MQFQHCCHQKEMDFHFLHDACHQQVPNLRFHVHSQTHAFYHRHDLP